MEKATREDWKNVPFPDEYAVLDYAAKFSDDDFEKLAHGLIPEEMEDKWFVYFENDTLYLHRSWVGTCIYKVTLQEVDEAHQVTSALVNRNEEEYRSDDDSHDAAILDFLIRNLLLGQSIPFPIRKGDQGIKGAFQHHVSGTGYEEKELG